MAGTSVGAIVGAGVLVPIGFVLSDDDSSGATGARLASYPRARVADLSQLKVGEPVWFDYPFEAASNLLVKTGKQTLGGVGPDRDIVAFSNQCTHMGCPITDFDAESNTLGPCPCHFSSFDLSRDGIVSFGQATQNLPRVLLEVEEDVVYADGVFRLIYGHDNNLAGESLVTVKGA